MTARVAIVHDALVNTGGAERVVLFMQQAFPQADIYTSAYLPDRTYPAFRTLRVLRFPWASWVGDERALKLAWPLVARSFGRLPWSDYDVVLCSTTFAAKAIRPPADVKYCLYCYAPFRLLWSPESYLPRTGRMLSPLLAPLRAWDRRQTRRAARVATTSRHMAGRLAACYGVEAAIIPAPIEWDTFRPAEGEGDYYLVVSRLNRYKRIDLAVDACRALGRRLLVAGEGPLRAELQRRAGTEIRFLGRVSEGELRQLYAGCRALLFPAEEDYGLVPLEVQASGRPVIALGRGGALETIEDGVSGIFFEQQQVDDLVNAIQRFEGMAFSRQAIRECARRFDVPHFVDGLRSFVDAERQGDEGYARPA